MSEIKLTVAKCLSVMYYLEKNSQDMEGTKEETTYYFNGRTIKLKVKDNVLTANNTSQNDLENLVNGAPDVEINQEFIDKILKEFFKNKK